jgi:hypothetical protein
MQRPTVSLLLPIVLLPIIGAIGGAACSVVHSARPDSVCEQAKSLGCDDPAARSPTREERQRFVKALITVYEYARDAAGTAPLQKNPGDLHEAAESVQELKPLFGEFWRRMAIAELAATGIDKPNFREAICAMHVDPARLQLLIPDLKRTSYFGNLDNVYQSLRDYFRSCDSQGVPSCNHTTPQTAAGQPPNAWSASALTTVWLQLSPSDLATAADPQNWDNPCGNLFFKATYKTADSDPNSGVFPGVCGCDANPSAAIPAGTNWTGDLYERFTPFPVSSTPSADDDFLSNILHIINTPTVDTYKLHYELASPLCALLQPDLLVPNSDNSAGLFADDGDLIATSSGLGVNITATKTIGFMNAFPHYPPPVLANQTGAMLNVLSDGIPYWFCCPKTGAPDTFPCP